MSVGRRLSTFALLFVAFSLVACGSERPGRSASLAPGPSPCAGPRSHPVRWSHVVWILMENHAYSQVVGSPDAPYLGRLARECGVATNYHAVAHPSLPNYLALTSGSTQGVRGDGTPAEEAIGSPPSIFTQSASWRAYAETMPRPCASTDAGDYAVRHNPPPYYSPAECDRRDLPLPAQPSLSAAFTFVAPNLCHDMHDCDVSTGDRWLAREVPKLTRTREYRSGGTVVFIVWDEDDGGAADNRVALLAVAPGLHSRTVRARFTHYALLRATEEMLGLRPLGQAVTAPGLRLAFGL